MYCNPLFPHLRPLQSFPMDQLHDHEHLCGRKEVLCHICKQVCCVASSPGFPRLGAS